MSLFRWRAIGGLACLTFATVLFGAVAAEQRNALPLFASVMTHEEQQSLKGGGTGLACVGLSSCTVCTPSTGCSPTVTTYTYPNYLDPLGPWITYTTAECSTCATYGRDGCSWLGIVLSCSTGAGECSPYFGTMACGGNETVTPTFATKLFLVWICAGGTCVAPSSTALMATGPCWNCTTGP